MLRSLFAVLAGNVIWAVLWLGSTALLRSLLPAQFQVERLESFPLLLLLIALSVVYSVIAGYLTARLARRKEFAHTLALGIVQLALGIIAEAANFNALPLWYHIVFLLLLIPANLFGGRLRSRQHQESFA